MTDDPGPSTSQGVISPRKKRRRISLSATEKLMTTNVFKFVVEQESKTCDVNLGEKINKKDCVQKTADILGISQPTVFRVLKEKGENMDFLPPKPKGRRLSFKDKLDDFDFENIRRKVHQFFFRNEAPTLTKVQQAINDDDDLPNFSISTVRKILKHLNFKYATRNRKSMLIDRNDIILWRKIYLLQIQQYRRDGKCIYYQDETWVNEGHTVKKVWQDTKIESRHEAFLEGYSTGLKAPTGKGRRLIISHIGNEEGFVEGGQLIFEGKKNKYDYHEEMDAQRFEEWLRQVLPKLKKDSVLVIDNAPYHSRRLEQIPSTNWRKGQIQEWLHTKNIAYEPSMVKAELIEIVKREKYNYMKYAVDELAAEYGVTVLRLPPYHCELNPIELVWAQVKGHVARNNKTFKMNEVKILFEEALAQVTPQKWKDCVDHVKNVVEVKMRQLDHLIDDVTDAFIIQVTDSDDDLSSSEIENTDEEEFC